jgi:hypothetical protein
MSTLTKEQAMVFVEQAKALGIAFVEDDYAMDEELGEIYNPMVNRPEAEAWLLDTLMKLKI